MTVTASLNTRRRRRKGLTLAVGNKGVESGGTGGKSEFELTLNKLSAAQRTGQPAALTPGQCELLLNRLDELMLALEKGLNGKTL